FPGSSTSPSAGRSGHRFESSWIGCDRWCLPPADPWDARRRTACEAPIVWTCLECRSPTTETTDRPPGRVWDRGGEDWGGGPGDRDRPARGGKAGRGGRAEGGWPERAGRTGVGGAGRARARHGGRGRGGARGGIEGHSGTGPSGAGSEGAGRKCTPEVRSDV